jgi:hypothetical protein
MDIEYPAFGTIVVEGTRYDHDVIIEDGVVRARKKGPSKPRKTTHGHTPLTAAEDIPWSKPRLVIGSGYSGSLPITADVTEEAAARGVVVEVMPTAEACGVLRRLEPSDANAILHVTC